MLNKAYQQGWLYGLDTAFDAVLDIIKCVGEGNNVTD